MRFPLFLVGMVMSISLNAQTKLERPWRLMLQDHTVSPQEFEEAFQRQTAGQKPSEIKEYKKYLMRSNLYKNFQDADGNFVVKEHLQKLIARREQINKARGLESPWISIEPETDLLVKCCLWDGCGIPEIPADEVMNVRNRLLEVAIHPQASHIMWLTSPNGGAWKSTDAGETWQEVSSTWPHGGCRKIALHPTDSNVVYVATGGDEGDFRAYGVQKSEDGGKTWTLLHGERDDITAIYQLSLDPLNPDRLYAATNRGFFLSADAGLSWQEASPVAGQTYQDFILVPRDGITQIQLLLRDRTNRVQLYQSNDSGQTFEQIMLPYEQTMDDGDDFVDARIAYSPADPNIVYLVGWPDSNEEGVGYTFEKGYHHLYKSLDGGQTFARLPDNPELFSEIGTTWGTYQFEVNPLDANDLAFGAICSGFSKDGGQTWQQFTWHQVDKQFFTWHPTTNELYCVDDGGLVKLTKQNEIVDLNDPQLIQYYDLTHASDLSYFGGGTQDAGTMIVKDDMRYRIGGGDGMTTLVDPIDPNIVFISSQRGWFKKTLADDPTRGLSYLTSDDDNDQDGTWLSQIVMHPWNHNKLYAAVRNVFYSDDNGNTWQRLTSNEDIGYTPDFLRISEVSPQVLMVGSQNGSLHKSEDHGRTWSSLGRPFDRIRDIEMDHKNPNLLWVAGQQSDRGDIGIFESRDGGVTWVSISKNIENTVIHDLLNDKNSDEGLYAVTTALTQVYYHHKTCSEWTNHSAGLPNSSTSRGALDIVYQLGKIRLGTNGRGAWEADLIEVNEALTLIPPRQPSMTIEKCLSAVELVAHGESSVDSYHWYLNDELVSSTEGPRYLPSEGGLWSVRAKNGIQYSYASEQVEIMLDEAELIRGPSVICQGEIGHFSIMGLEGVDTYTWYVPGIEEGCVGSNSIYLPIQQSGTVSVVVAGNCGIQTFNTDVQVDPCTSSIGLDFDGSDDYILVDDFDWSQISDFTIETNFNVRSYPADFVALAEFGNDWNDHIALEILSSGRLKISMSKWADAWVGDELTSDQVIALETWYHVACSYNTSSRTLITYLDGVEIGRIENVKVSPGEIRFREGHIGTSFHWEDTQKPFFDGKLDDFRFWEIARSAAEISLSQYCYEPQGIDNLLLDYTFQEGNPSGENTAIRSVENHANYKNNGELIGFGLAGPNSNYIATALEQQSCDEFLPSCPGINTDGTTAIDDYASPKFLVHPNPTSNLLLVRPRDSDVHDYTVSLYNMVGQVLNKAENLVQIDVSSLNEGLYQVIIEVPGYRSSFYQKIVVAR